MKPLRPRSKEAEKLLLTSPKVSVSPAISRAQRQAVLQRVQRSPDTLTRQDARILQRTIGNQATTRLLQSVLQAKLQLGPAGDKYEQEADQVAEDVVRSTQDGPPVQRQGAEEGETVQSKGLPGIGYTAAQSTTPVQRKPITFQKLKPVQIQRDDDEPPRWQQPTRSGGTTRSGLSLGRNRQQQSGSTPWQGTTTPTTGGRSGLNIGRNRQQQSSSAPWQTTTTSTTGNRVGFSMGSRSEESQKAALIRRIRDSYGINIDQTAGVNAVRNAYPNAPLAVRNGVRARDWTLRELQDVDRALSHYAQLLGPNRPGTLGAQPITSFSRLEQGIDEDTASGVLDNTTAGETFASNITMFDEGNDIRDFATDKANPTQDELRQGFRGTIEHELSHGFIEGLSINGQTMVDEFADQMVFWDTITDRHYTDPLRPGSKVRSRELAVADGAEAPITLYGATDAYEDLAESMMFYFENPTKLSTDCPLRFAFIQTNIQPFLDGTA